MFDKTASSFKKFVAESRHDQFKEQIDQKRREQDQLVHDIEYAQNMHGVGVEQAKGTL